MKITVQHDDGKVEVFQNITDAYLCVRQLDPVKPRDGDIAMLPQTRGYSWGGNVRELVKEITQAIVELQELLRRASAGSG